MTGPVIKDAATIIVLRDTPDGVAVLMGQRGKKAAFMPDKYVFPGGAVDPEDQSVDLGTSLPEPTATRLAQHATTPINAIAAAAIRELWEETGLIMGTPAPWPNAPDDWAGFAAQTMRPAADGLCFMFRAITPKGRPRRFDARFFVADASAISNDLDGFHDASGELIDLRWITLADTDALDLPFVTRIVLAEIRQYVARGRYIDSVPFFTHVDDENAVLHIGETAA